MLWETHHSFLLSSDNVKWESSHSNIPIAHATHSGSWEELAIAKGVQKLSQGCHSLIAYRCPLDVHLWPFLFPWWRKCSSATSYGCLSIYPIVLSSVKHGSLVKCLKNMKMWRLPITSNLALWIEGIFYSSIKFFIFLLKDSAWNSL